MEGIIQTVADDYDRGEIELREFLRSATRTDHERLDRIVSCLALTQRSDYRRFLRGTAAALIPVETALEASGVRAVVPDWPRRSRRAALLNDLAALGTTVAPLDSPSFLGRSHLLGAMYVLEGSRLGARVVRRMVLESDDPLVCEASSYLSHGDGENLWPSFLSALKVSGDIDRGEAAAAAVMVFAMFEQGIRCA